MTLTKEGMRTLSDGGRDVDGPQAGADIGSFATAAPAVGLQGGHALGTAQYDLAANPTASVSPICHSWGAQARSATKSSIAGSGAIVDGIFTSTQQGQTLTQSTAVEWA